ncbi:hypothetical protein [Riemerella columbina]|uniref:hypothetical protein n=1 Tax=Riemerella columbina TaxID=103810 RepID=UPI00036E74E4|nr:hypothetical protein [Riemerella columbina]
MKTNITLLALAVSALTACSYKNYQLTQDDRKLLKKYPEIILLHSGKQHILLARRLEIIDSIQNAHQQDLAQEFKEEQYHNNSEDF